MNLTTQLAIFTATLSAAPDCRSSSVGDWVGRYRRARRSSGQGQRLRALLPEREREARGRRKGHGVQPAASPEPPRCVTTSGPDGTVVFAPSAGLPLRRPEPGEDARALLRVRRADAGAVASRRGGLPASWRSDWALSRMGRTFPVTSTSVKHPHHAVRYRRKTKGGHQWD